MQQFIYQLLQAFWLPYTPQNKLVDQAHNTDVTSDRGKQAGLGKKPGPLVFGEHLTGKPDRDDDIGKNRKEAEEAQAGLTDGFNPVTQHQQILRNNCKPSCQGEY